MAIIRVANVLELIGFLLGFCGLLGEQRLLVAERTIRHALESVASTTWPRAIIRRVLHNFDNNLTLKICFMVAVFVNFVVFIIVFTFIKLYLYSQVENFFGNSSIVLTVLSIVFKFAMLLVLLAVATNIQANIKPIMILNIVVILYPVVWLPWVIILVAYGILFCMLFIVINILIFPYRVADTLTTRFELSSTITLIGFIIGLVGICIQTFLA